MQAIIVHVRHYDRALLVHHHGRGVIEARGGCLPYPFFPPFFFGKRGRMSAKISALLAGVLVALLPGGSALELRGATVSSAPLAFGVLMPPAPRPALGSRGTSRLCSVARGTQFQPAVLARKRHGGADMGVRMSSGGGATPKEEDFPLIRLVTFLTR